MTPVHVLGLIPARGGSKGIPGKNLRGLLGRSLVERAVAVARESGVIDRIVVSTDDDRIRGQALAAGAEVPFMRPSELATDAAPMLPVVQHAITTLAASGWTSDVVVLLQPSSPLRTADHIRGAIEMLTRLRCDSVVSVVQVPPHLAPSYVMAIDDRERLVPYLAGGEHLTRRQDAPVAYYRDGTVYAFWGRVALAGSIYGQDCRPMIVSPDASVTLDSHEEWEIAEARMRKRNR